MKIYVATAWEAREHAKRIAGVYEKRGHTITHKWWDEDETWYAESVRYRSECASRYWSAVDCADVFVLLTHPKAYGAMVELGMALQGGARVVLVHGETHPGETRDCVFYHLPNVREVVGVGQLLEGLP